MPDIGPFHPQLVHFVLGVGLTGVALRLVSLTGKAPWTKPAGAALLILTGLTSVVTVISGENAHGPVERMPGVREAVGEHEEAGELTRNLFLLVAALEVAALALRSRLRVERGLLIVSALAGAGASAAAFVAGQRGGELVYAYAGGVGLRSGNPEDLHRLLVAGLYHESRAAREAGRREEAQRLTDELVRQVPDDPAVALLHIESTLKDRQDAKGALAALATLQVPADNPRFAIQKGMLESEALAASGQRDSARAVLLDLQKRFPRAQRFIADALTKLQ
jgi:uncharacterized membrane protein